MKKMVYRSSVVLVLILGFFGFKKINTSKVAESKMESNFSVDPKEALTLTAILNYLQQVHFEPKPIDDNLSKFVFKTYLDRLDGGKRYFTQQDYDLLKKHELNIDDQINNRTFDFFEDAFSIIEKRMKLSDSLYQAIINSPLDININREIELDEEKKPYAKSEQELKEYWKEFLTYELVTRLDRKIKDEEKKEVKAERKSTEKLKEEALGDIKKTFGDWFARLKKLRRSDRFEAYMGTITNYYDPHTDYFSPKEKQDFDISMGGRIEGIGAKLLQEGDNIKIESLVPGGPAYESKEVAANDIILSAAQEGKEPVDLTGMRVDDAVQYIRGKKGTKVILRLKKTDATVKTVTLVRDQIITEESVAKSAIFDMPGVIENVGYIKLPKFYSSFDDGPKSTSCAEDVAKEVEKLKESKVNGIILDLRNNTGGSLSDVVDMSGLFVEQGPIVQVKSRQDKPYIYNDKDSKVQYEGPFIILVNSMSASASEIIAAAMQDYKRAVIVGSNSTFGKGSVQRFFDLDKAITGNEGYKPLGEIKMTTQKFYRVNGQTTQLGGVLSDIVLPDNYMDMKVGEKEYKNALSSTTISPLTYTQNVAIIANMDELKEKSKQRISKDPNFGKVVENAKRFKAIKENTKSNLSLTEYSKQTRAYELEAKKFDNLFKEDIANFKIRNIAKDLEALNADTDSSKRARNEEWIKDMKKDFYLTEALNIMKDIRHVKSKSIGGLK
jgi:carboxyl-terminal processing protease